MPDSIVPSAPARERARDTGPDPIARRSPRMFRLFGWYLVYYFWRRFHAIRVMRDTLPDRTSDRPLIIYGNHPSWWDPVLYMLLSHRLFPDRAGFGPMDAQSLGRYSVLEKMGVFGIDPDSPRGAARFLDSSLRILAHPLTILWITAEGAFTDHRTRPIRLRPGIAHLARRVPDAVILPVAVEYVFWNESRPEILIRFGTPLTADALTGVPAWTARLEQALTETMDQLAAASARRDPAPFDSLLHGGAGVGGIYDAWRRLRAWAGLRRFDPSHEARQ